MMEVRLHKLFLIIVKYLPFIIGIIYFLIAILNCFGIECIILINLIFISPISALFILAASFVFKFCIWHRLPIYYCMILEIISFIDYYSPLLIPSNLILLIYLSVTILMILIGMYFKNRYNNEKRKKNRRINKKLKR